MKPLIIGITGASGAILAERLAETIVEYGQTVALVCTKAGEKVWELERPESFRQWVQRKGFLTYDIDNIAAPIASGTFQSAGMIVIPSSMHTIAALAHGLSSNLLERAADVTLKERRRLIVVPRETPLSSIHLANLLTLTQAGAIILPPVLTFYNQPLSLDDVVDHLIYKVLSLMGFEDRIPERFRYSPQ